MTNIQQKIDTMIDAMIALFDTTNITRNDVRIVAHNVHDNAMIIATIDYDGDDIVTLIATFDNDEISNCCALRDSIYTQII
jgi:hypothetical protein